MKFLEGKKKPISDVSRGQRKNAHSHEKHHHLLTQSGRIAPRRLQPAHSHMGTMQMRDFFAPPPPILFFFPQPCCVWGSAGCFPPGTLFPAPPSWRGNTPVAGPSPQPWRFGWHNVVCKPFGPAGREPFGVGGGWGLGDSPVEPIPGSLWFGLGGVFLGGVWLFGFFFQCHFWTPSPMAQAVA